mgnify:CR=1 FL=1
MKKKNIVGTIVIVLFAIGIAAAMMQYTKEQMVAEKPEVGEEPETVVLSADENPFGVEIKKINEFVSSNCNLQACTLAQEINKIFVETFGTDVYDENLEQCTIVAKKILRVEM